jgi:calcineurin-like phosphoesterase
LIINRFLTNLPVRFEAASGDVRFCGAIIDADEKTGHARWIQRIMITDNA